ncbi:MAG: hypothetical protein JO327_12765 [Nitrososphaeraceae archaeon]|nr:hypothetical protein [Nitrososphaeraceae archaeon]MBV9668987.1 hypothetical protein [Nitrososphaeraceae archaeon]
MSNQNRNSDAYNINSKTIIEKQKKDTKVIKAVEELQKEQRESEQLSIDPEQVLEEKEKRQPQSMEE